MGFPFSILREARIMPEYFDKPCAIAGLISFRYRGNYGWIMIGATDQNDALHQALISLSHGEATLDRLERWCILSNGYVTVKGN